MATNPFFEVYDQEPEQELWNDLIIESIQIVGDDVKYIPRNLINYDQLFGADDSSRFDAAYTIEMQVINTYGFTGDKDFYSQFGHQVRDEVTFAVSRDRWMAEIGIFEDKRTPSEGDLIWVKRYNKMFSIKYVDPREMFYQLGKLYTWELTCEVFEYSGEDIDTGDANIDDQFDVRSLNDLDWALTDENGFVLTDGDGNILTVDEYDIEVIVPGSQNDFLPEELKKTTDLDVKLQDPFGFLQSQ